MEKLDSLVETALQLFAGITDAAQLEQAKARYLGKAGALTEMQKDLGKLPAAERPAMGARFNSAKQRIEAALNAQREKIQAAKLDAQLALEALDVTLPGRGIATGGLHPVTRTMGRVEAIFRTMGFEVADGPDVGRIDHVVGRLHVHRRLIVEALQVAAGLGEEHDVDRLAGFALGTAAGYLAHEHESPVILNMLPGGFSVGLKGRF